MFPKLTQRILQFVPIEPKLRQRTVAQQAFIDIGPGAERWLRSAASSGVSRIRAKMARAVELAALCGREPVDRALAGKGVKPLV